MTTTSLATLPENRELDQQIEKLVGFIFGFKEPENLALPTIDWDLFKVPEGLVRPDFNGIVCGEALSGLHPDPNVFIWPEVAHIDLMTGYSTGPMGTIFGNAVANQKYGFNNLLAVVNPNMMVKPPVAIVTKVETNSRERANQMFGSAQSAVADATVDALARGFFPADGYDKLVCVAGVFIDPNAGAKRDEAGKLVREGDKLVMLTGDEAAASAHRIYCFNYVSMLFAWWMAMTGGRSAKNLVDAKVAGAAHVLRGFKPKAA